MNVGRICAFVFILAAVILSGISIFWSKENCIGFMKYALWFLIFGVIQIFIEVFL